MRITYTSRITSNAGKRPMTYKRTYLNLAKRQPVDWLRQAAANPTP